MEAASLSLQHGGDHATSDNAQPPSPRTFLAVSPPQIGLEACPPKGWEKEREILQLQAELEAANAMVQALEGVSDGGPTASQHVPQYVPVAVPREEEKVVYRPVSNLPMVTRKGHGSSIAGRIKRVNAAKRAAVVRRARLAMLKARRSSAASWNG